MEKQGIKTTPPAQPSPQTYFGGKVTKQQLKRWGPVAIVAAAVVVMLAIFGVRALRADVRISRFDRDAMGLLGQKPVQDDLKITEEQLAKLTKLNEDRTKAMSYTETMGMTVYDKEQKEHRLLWKAIPKILDAGQLKRLKQIHLQQREQREQRGGKHIWSEEDVAKALKLTKAQKEQIADIQKQYRKEQREQGEQGKGGGNRDEAQKQAAREKAQELRKAHDEQLLAVLTLTQQTKWRNMIGEPFTGEVALPRGGRPGNRGNNPVGQQGERGGRNAGR